VTYPFPARFDEALTFAAERHSKQLRKCTGIPYITHPLIVAETLAYHYPSSHSLIVAALLHDVVEDTDTTIVEVEERFGAEVAVLVAAVTKPELANDSPEQNVEAKAIRWKAQRQAMLDALHADDQHANADVLRLKAADALANLRAISRDLSTPGVGSTVWSRFKVGREDSLWFYEAILAKVSRLEGEPLVGELQRELETVRAAPD
jgi:(p)ppGpp synthase/HD superfamily hydrolase